MSRILVLSVFTITATVHTASGQTDNELREIYVRRDLKRMEEVANAGDARAQAWMCLMMRQRYRHDEAVSWCRLGAGQGSSFALSLLIDLLPHKEAVVLLREAAEKGNAHAQERLALFLVKGLGVEQDRKEAIRWYKKAASHGGQYSYLPLATLLDQGAGGKREPDEAYTYALLANYFSDSSDVRSRETASEMTSRLGKEIGKVRVRKATDQAGQINPRFAEKKASVDRADAVLTAIILTMFGLFAWAVVGVVRKIVGAYRNP